MVNGNYFYFVLSDCVSFVFKQELDHRLEPWEGWGKVEVYYI